jgi:hypothetical protein
VALTIHTYLKPRYLAGCCRVKFTFTLLLGRGGGFRVKVMKRKLQGSSRFRAPSKALRGTLALCSHGHMLFFFLNLQKQDI